MGIGRVGMWNYYSIVFLQGDDYWELPYINDDWDKLAVYLSEWDVENPKLLCELTDELGSGNDDSVTSHLIDGHEYALVINPRVGYAGLSRLVLVTTEGRIVN